MTAAGTVAPAKVLVIGAGVAGLQAIATAETVANLPQKQERPGNVGDQQRVEPGADEPRAGAGSQRSGIRGQGVRFRSCMKVTLNPNHSVGSRTS